MNQNPEKSANLSQAEQSKEGTGTENRNADHLDKPLETEGPTYEHTSVVTRLALYKFNEYLKEARAYYQKKLGFITELPITFRESQKVQMVSLKSLGAILNKKIDFIKKVPESSLFWVLRPFSGLLIPIELLNHKSYLLGLFFSVSGCPSDWTRFVDLFVD